MNSRPSLGCLRVFSTPAWNNATSKGGLGFIMINSNALVCYADFCSTMLVGKLELDLKALCWALSHLLKSREKCSTIFISSKELWRQLLYNEDVVSWRHRDTMDNLLTIG